MPIEDSESLPEQEGVQQRNSVYDFFYHDARRIASYLSQFEVYGTPQSVKATETVGKAETMKGTLSGSGGVPLTYQGSAGFEVVTGTDQRELAEWTYDPLWLNAIRFLDYLASRNLIRSNINQARLGQFVQVSGNLHIIDQSMMSSLWKGDLAWKIFGEDENTLDKMKKRQIAENKKNLERISALMGILPHSIQVRVINPTHAAWAILRETSLVGAPFEAALRHGTHIPDRWTMIGILDGLPRDMDDPRMDLGSMDWDKAFWDQGLTALSDALGPWIRQILGRRKSDFAVSPLLIFREIQTG